jgi:hypothetical protein
MIAEQALDQAIRNMDYQTIIDVCSVSADFRAACQRRDWRKENLYWFKRFRCDQVPGQPWTGRWCTRHDFVTLAKQLVDGVQDDKDLSSDGGRSEKGVYAARNEATATYYDDFIALVRGGKGRFTDKILKMKRDDIYALTDVLLPYAARSKGNRLEVAFRYATNQFVTYSSHSAGTVGTQVNIGYGNGLTMDGTIDPSLADKIAPYLRPEQWVEVLCGLALAGRTELAKTYWAEHRAARRADHWKSLGCGAKAWGWFVFINGSTSLTGREWFVNRLIYDMIFTPDDSQFEFVENSPLFLGPFPGPPEDHGDYYRLFERITSELLDELEIRLQEAIDVFWRLPYPGRLSIFERLLEQVQSVKYNSQFASRESALRSNRAERRRLLK